MITNTGEEDLKASKHCPICNWSIPHNHNLIEEIMMIISPFPLDSIPSSIFEEYEKEAKKILDMLTSLAHFAGLKNKGQLRWENV